VAQILPRFYQARMDIQALKQLKAEVDDQPEALVTMRLPGDPNKLRGIPVIGVFGGAGGHIPGTRPDHRQLD
jgi:hypothetical protein